MLDVGQKLDDAHPSVLSLYRMVISLLFVCHGAATVLGAFGGPEGGKPSVGAWPGWWAGLIQLTGGILVFLGIGEVGTRVAAVVSSGSMAYAYFTVHQKHAVWPIQNGGELSVLFCWSFLLLAITGPGAWTLTWLVSRASARTAPAPVASTETT
ncbi:DoxX family protein [Streptomyces sp. NBC_01190]|uniref:DoxX family protein n=1 Tax=Streptomyces sp. NBC_01190 TaxID=2903767 RepID=UPI003863E654|nr:DoxX family protein [Streptomyces sp. NBC_01190]